MLNFMLAVLLLVPCFQDQELDLKTVCNTVIAEFKKKELMDADLVLDSYKFFKKSLPKASKMDKKLIENVFKKQGAIKPNGDNQKIFAEAAACLTLMEKKGLVILRSLLKSKHLVINKNLTDKEKTSVGNVLIAYLDALGTFKDKKCLKLIYDFLHRDDNQMVIAACKALSHYKEYSITKRKPIVKVLIARYTEIVNKEYGIVGPAAKNRLKPRPNIKRIDFTDAKIPINRTLHDLTGQNLHTAKSWRYWFQANEDAKKWIEGEYEEEDPWAGGLRRGPRKKDN